jgi:hypothetical protein
MLATLGGVAMVAPLDLAEAAVEQTEAPAEVEQQQEAATDVEGGEDPAQTEDHIVAEEPAVADLEADEAEEPAVENLEANEANEANEATNDKTNHSGHKVGSKR